MGVNGIINQKNGIIDLFSLKISKNKHFSTIQIFLLNKFTKNQIYRYLFYKIKNNYPKYWALNPAQKCLKISLHP